MKNCENVYCMHSKDVHFISVDVPLTDINETIEAWLFDDEDYPACNRLVRRFAKRTRISHIFPIDHIFGKNVVSLY
jgi:hypothetical protein